MEENHPKKKLVPMTTVVTSGTYTPVSRISVSSTSLLNQVSKSALDDVSDNENIPEDPFYSVNSYFGSAKPNGEEETDNQDQHSTVENV